MLATVLDPSHICAQLWIHRPTLALSRARCNGLLFAMISSMAIALQWFHLGQLGRIRFAISCDNARLVEASIAAKNCSSQP